MMRGHRDEALQPHYESLSCSPAVAARCFARPNELQGSPMKKHLLAAAAVALLATSFGAQAAPPEAGVAPPPPLSAEDLSAFADARVAGLKAGLKLTPEQEKNWPQLEAAIRDNAKADAARIGELRERARGDRQDHGDHQDHDAVAALHRHAQALAARSAEVEKLAQAATPLYASLDASQKRRFNALLHHAAQERLQHAFAEHGFGGSHPGFGPH
jgi:zinc resistance-associated protein